MYIEVVPNRGSPPTVLLRESVREGHRVRKRTLANLSALSRQQVEAMRRILKGDRLAAVAERPRRAAAPPHGHVQAVLSAMDRLGIGPLIAPHPSPERTLITGLVAAHILEPEARLDATLPAALGVADADEDDVRAALDWLLERQGSIDRALAVRHLKDSGVALYDLGSCALEAAAGPAARRSGRGGKPGRLQVGYGLLTDIRGCPVAVEGLADGPDDPAAARMRRRTGAAQEVGWASCAAARLRAVRERFGIKTLVAVGEGGMIPRPRRGESQGGRPGPAVLGGRPFSSPGKGGRPAAAIAWISALKAPAVRDLAASGALRPGLFAERSLLELAHPDYPGERLVAWRAPGPGTLRARRRRSALEATSRELEKVRGLAARGQLEGQGAIGVRAGTVVDRYKVARHFALDIRDDGFDFRIDEAKVAAEAALDGISVLRTSLAPELLSAEDAVRACRMLGAGERAFRAMRATELKAAPMPRPSADRVRAHLVLCLLAYYVEWHMREASRPGLS